MSNVTITSALDKIFSDYEAMVAKGDELYDGNDCNKLVVAITDNAPASAYQVEDSGDRVITVEGTELVRIKPEAKDGTRTTYPGSVFTFLNNAPIANWACKRLANYCDKGGNIRSSGNVGGANASIRDAFKSLLAAKAANAEQLNAVV